MLDVVWGLVVLALAAVVLLPQERRVVRLLALGLAVVVLALGTWRTIHDGKWWMLLIGMAIGAVLIGVDRQRSRPREG